MSDATPSKGGTWEALSMLLSGWIVIGGVIGYIPQYLQIQNTGRREGFSPLVSLILLISNILRCLFWLGKRFETELLYQSIVMVASQLVMLELCVRVARQQRVNSGVSSKRTLFDFNTSHFWKWDDFQSYVVFLGGFTAVFGMFAVAFMNDVVVTETLGLFALCIEASLGMPQWYENQATKSVAGLRKELIGSWFLGDLFKTIYFIAMGTPLQFTLCGLIQLTVDCMIVYQMVTFPKGRGSISSPALSHPLPQGKGEF